ncbi:hypothetical protein SESI111939_21410 [Serratia silvae]
MATEIVGRVAAVGAGVARHKVGDIVAVGCLVDADPACPHCCANREQYSPSKVLTYNSPDKYGTAPVTYGGYAQSIVVDEHFVLQVLDNLGSVELRKRRKCLIFVGSTTLLQTWKLSASRRSTTPMSVWRKGTSNTVLPSTCPRLRTSDERYQAETLPSHKSC